LVSGILFGIGFIFTLATAGLLAVAVSGTFNSFTSGVVIKSSEVNANFATLKTAIEGIVASQWTTNGANIGYTAGNVGIGTASPNSKLQVSGRIVSAAKEITVGSNSEDVSTVNILYCNTNVGPITLGGLSGAVNGRQLIIVNNGGQALIVQHNFAFRNTEVSYIYECYPFVSNLRTCNCSC
jgi:hypothetical protein